MNRIYYRVMQGDTMEMLSQKFGVSVEELMTANKLSSNEIYTGQRLIIPVDTYQVAPGDTLYSIAKTFDTTVESIMYLNDLDTAEISVGNKLIIPLYTELVTVEDNTTVNRWAGKDYPVLTTFNKGTEAAVDSFNDYGTRVTIYNGMTGYIERQEGTVDVYDGSKPICNILGFYTQEEGPGLPSSYESFSNNGDVLSSTGLFMYQINRDDPTTIAKFGGDFSDEEVKKLVKEGHANNIVMYPTIHNLLYERGKPEINREVVSQMLSTEESQLAFIGSCLELVEAMGFDGVNMDIEDAYEEDEDNISLFYERLAWALNQKGYILSVDVPARTTDQDINPFSDPYNYEAIGKVANEFVVMLYNEYGWPGSGPGPAVSGPGMREVLDYTITKVPPEKVMAAVSVFGFDFNLDTGKASYATYQNAMKKSETYNAPVVFDEKMLTPVISYTDEEGQNHEVWFENGRSIYEKAKIAWEYGIKGLALWRLGMEDPEVFNVLRNDIVTEKRR